MREALSLSQESNEGAALWRGSSRMEMRAHTAVEGAESCLRHRKLGMGGAAAMATVSKGAEDERRYTCVCVCKHAQLH